MTLLTIDNFSVTLHKKQKKLHVLHDISAKVQPNTIVGIVGGSGSGKSMLARSILGLEPPGARMKTEGKITFNDLLISSYQEKKMRSIRGKEIAMIFQNPMSCLNPTMKIVHQMQEIVLVHHPKYPKKLLHAQILEMLNSVGINNPNERLQQYPHELSGGMQQRIMIAMMMLLSPKLLIADEPTTALDVTVQSQILSLLKALQKKTQMSILFITHDLLLAHWLCDTVYVMHEGAIVEQGFTHQIFDHPKHPYTKKLIKALPSYPPLSLTPPAPEFKLREEVLV